MLHTRNNTDGSKLVIFSGIALYYGGNISKLDDLLPWKHQRDESNICVAMVTDYNSTILR